LQHDKDLSEEERDACRHRTGPSRRTAIIGWTLSGLLIAFLTFDTIIKLMVLDIVDETSAALGWGEGTAIPLGVILAICTILFAWPRTAVLGALLLTAYLGGAVATHARIGSPLFTHTLFGAYLGFFAWGGLRLPEPRLRALLPWRS